MSTIAVERLAEVFVEMADTLVDDFDIIEFLQGVTRHTSELIPATAAGLLLVDHRGQLQLMAASDEQARMVELFQVQALEGPCQDCYRLGSPVVNADLATAGGRWPQFAPRAVAAGFQSVHAFPLRLRGNVIGALNLFGRGPSHMEDSEVRVVQALADVATIGLLQQRAIQRAELLTDQLQTALSSRITIEQAKGALAQIHGCSPDEAFTLLRSWCRNHNRRLTEVAHAFTVDPTQFPELATPPREP